MKLTLILLITLTIVYLANGFSIGDDAEYRVRRFIPGGGGLPLGGGGSGGGRGNPVYRGPSTQFFDRDSNTYYNFNRYGAYEPVNRGVVTLGLDALPGLLGAKNDNPLPASYRRL